MVLIAMNREQGLLLFLLLCMLGKEQPNIRSDLEIQCVPSGLWLNRQSSVMPQGLSKECKLILGQQAVCSLLLLVYRV